MSKYTQAYQTFFLKTEAGKEYVLKLQELRNDLHRKAENELDHSHLYSQRARGVTEVLNVITTLTTKNRNLKGRGSERDSKN